MNQQQLEIAGAISLLETVLKLFKVRDKATQNVKQQPSGKSATRSDIYRFRPSSFNDWLGILLLAPKDGNGIFCLLDPERQRKLETLFMQPQDMGIYRTLSLPKELLFLFSFSACVGSVCLVDFSQTVCYQPWTSVSGFCTWLSVERTLFVAACK